VDIGPVNDSSGLFYSETGTSTATNGGTACTVTILFSWDLATPTTDSVGITYTISSSLCSTLCATGAGASVSRTSTHDLPLIPMPGNTQTVTEPTINTVI
jgi:hypothetical protein